MQTDNPEITTKAKTLNLVTRSRLLLNSMRFMPVCVIIGLVAGGMPGLVFVIPGSFALAVMVELLTGTIGTGSSNLLYGTGRSVRNPREQYAGTLNQVRYHKMCHDFAEALITIDSVLASEPNFPEALLLKAQIIWEGFQDAVGAKQCLIDLLEVEPDRKSPFHRWALALYREISASYRLKKTHELQKTAERHA
ncbi:MAG: hypothetical protein JRF72_05765 [Deltaproteobacteria bacterium]|jgi:hypothetical protein|nr:hypothetical protein [Deltaproteobacteria bacterium]